MENYTKIKFAKVTFPGNKSFHNIFLFLLEVESPTNVILPILETSLGPDISGVQLSLSKTPHLVAMQIAPNLGPMQVAFFFAGEITQVKESIHWVRCASDKVTY